ncbi:hypothetical protein MLD38_017334 [Melastoma candidum]|uniref:Uncharacterized protein n=1 Tax=Melastoma candidum TaxID=119954 RepID=A0ACB9QQG4_9MYRT|nr:hypothetical protein MLD38_017334 [Melastoma candidum]
MTQTPPPSLPYLPSASIPCRKTMILGTMDELASSLWNAPESMEELKQKIVYMSIELEAARMAADEEAKKHKESTRHLQCLLKAAYQERDEARDQLQMLLHKLPLSITPESSSLSPVFNPVSLVENPHMIPGKTSSGVTESSSLSLSHGTSPASSFLDPVSSPELSNPYNAAVDSSGGIGICLSSKGLDVGSRIIDDLARGRLLPQKGKLLVAVTEAGPLLQTLLVAGPLPRWRNPPPLLPIRIPALANAGQKPQMCSAAFLNFGNVTNSSQPWLVPPVTGGSGQNPLAKRQRLH